ncbi:MAG: AmpG family muropeptide MFS transporter [Deltaproteobacteria bacterium]|nr:MAG: AmpG family muropeptide MFS transporter [Deltaproteobacteria bacterium]
MKFSFWTLLGAHGRPRETQKKLGVVALLYFIQGAPAAILWEVLPVYLRLHGVSLRMIGGLRLLELPYSLKFFWSPLLHRYGDRRIWVSACMLGIAGVLLALPFLDVAGVGWIVLLLILGLTTLSATQDVAIDSYSVGLIKREEEGAANGVRASAYRVALVVFGGGTVFLAAVLEWSLLFILAAALFAILGLSMTAIPPLNLPEEAREHWLRGFLGWAGTWRVIPLVLFVLTYKLGEFAIGPMVKPFWVDYGKSIWPIRDDLMFQIGLFPTTFGIVLSVVGALTGGAFVSRYGIFHGVWFLGLLQAVSNLGYSFVDWLNLGRFGLYGASMFESLCGGLGTAAFLAFLMNVCQKEHATVQYAFLSSIFSLTGRLIGGISGLGAERYGYGNYFALTFLLALPAYLFLPWVKDWIQEGDNQGPSSTKASSE